MKKDKKELASTIMDELLGGPPKATEASDDDTVKISDVPPRAAEDNSSDRRMVATASTTVDITQNLKSPPASLAHSENLRLALDKIAQLEATNDKLVQENEELAHAGLILKRSLQTLKSDLEQRSTKLTGIKEVSEEEKNLLKQTLKARDSEISELKDKVSQLESRLQVNSHNVRSRERELENRLEIAKVEHQAIINSKDEMILDLKRKLDTYQMEMNNFRLQGQELRRSMEERQDVLRRTVKALRLALALIEGSDGEKEKAS